jgi:hypothetical protein
MADSQQYTHDEFIELLISTLDKQFKVSKILTFHTDWNNFLPDFTYLVIEFRLQGGPFPENQLLIPKQNILTFQELYKYHVLHFIICTN